MNAERTLDGHQHLRRCAGAFCPCFIEGRAVLGASHWEMLVFIAERRPDLLRDALAEVDSPHEPDNPQGVWCCAKHRQEHWDRQAPPSSEKGAR